MRRYFFVLVLAFLFVAPPVSAQQEDNQAEQPSNPEPVAQQPSANGQQGASVTPTEIENDYFRGKVLAVLEEGVTEIGTFQQPYQKLRVEIISGEDTGHVFEHEYQLTKNNVEDQKLEVGDKVVVVKVVGEQTEYYVAEPYRLPSVIVIFLLFFLLAIVFARKKGFTALVGLAFSIFIIVQFIVPQIAAGRDPLFISLIGSFFILLFSLYLAHGFNKRTTVALAGTFITLVLAAILSLVTVSAADLFGLGSEEALSLLQGQFRNINLQGLLLGGIIIGALGVLDDVTTAQSATVEELHRANPKLGVKELYARGISVGREHIASLVNTLALAYVGASLPLMLIFTKVDFPLWVNLNSEFLVEEIMRTLIGSSALILAVPITTFIAARVFVNAEVDPDAEPSGHVHSH